MNDTVVISGIAALLAAAGWGLGTILFERFMSSRSDAPSAAACNLYKNSVAGAVFVLVALLTGSAAIPSEAWSVLLLSGLLGFAVGDTCTFAALPRCGVQLTSLLSTLIPPLAALLSWIFLGESLTLWTLASMGVVLVGVTIVITERGSGGGEQPQRGVGVLFAVLAALSQALAIVIGRHGFQGVEVFPGTVARVLGGVAGAFLMVPLLCLFTRKPLGAEFRGLVIPFARAGLARGLLPATFFAAILILPLHSLAVRGAPGGVSASLLATTPLFTLPLGLAFGIRPTARTVLGTAIGFAGAVGTILSTS